MKTATIALSAAALIAAVPAVFGQGSKTRVCSITSLSSVIRAFPATLYGVRCKPRFR